MLGSFLKGAIAGIIGLGALSWLVTALAGNPSQDESEEEE